MTQPVGGVLAANARITHKLHPRLTKGYEPRVVSGNPGAVSILGPVDATITLENQSSRPTWYMVFFASPAINATTKAIGAAVKIMKNIKPRG